MNNNTKYRPDIDGLRALAVLPVVFFHIFPEYLTGGYIGVDIFFVISGYLISLIIFKEVKNKCFSFVDFYIRRIRRIFPTLITVLIFSLVLGWFALFPDEYALLGKHVSGSAVFISNLVLLSESGYFDASSLSKPLLHLWSLAVEEQFYIIWPLLLLFSRKIINPVFIAFTLLTLSFCLNIHYVGHDQSLSFYSPVMRFWEILSGSCLAWLQVNRDEITERFTGRVPSFISLLINSDGRSSYRHLISLAGLGCVIYAMAAYTEGIAFPGWYAVMPVLGAVMIITAGQHAFVNRFILSRKIVIWFGLISYPLYLWHWPLISFAYIMDSGYPDIKVRASIIILSIVMAWVSYAFIERKLRRGGSPVRVTISLIVVMCAVGVSGWCIFTHDGIESRFSKTEKEIKDDAHIKAFMKNSLDNCKKLFPEWDNKTENYCALQKEKGNNKIAIIGDSHGNHLFLGLSEIHKDEGVAVFPASCASPLLDIAAGLYTYESLNSEKKIFNGRQNTYKLINQAYQYVLSNKKIKDVILAHNPICSYNGNVMDMRDPSETNGKKIIERGLRRSLDALTGAGKWVTIVIDNPEIKFEPKACIVRPLRLTRAGAQCSYDRSVYDQNAAHRTYNTIIMNVVKDYPTVRVVDLSKKLCNDKTCTLFIDGHEIYEDRTHLNKYGSRYVAPFILGNESGK